jgi:CubicO group peptidase (beta-lactamase class C family)
MLLTHRGGLEAFAPLYRDTFGRDAYLAAINSRPLRYEPGTRAVYSDWDMILLQLVMERITGQTLDVFARQRIFEPLGMSDSFFNPDPALLPRIAPTELEASTGQLIHGRVHDPNAHAMGGVAGHAGLFSSARDLSIFAQTMLNGGHYGTMRILRPTTIARWTARQDADTSRALGWDTPSGRSSAGRYFSPRSFGHTGFTGTSMWLDPVKDMYVILLTNRVNPSAQSTRVFQLRRDVADAAQWAVMDAPLVEWEVTRTGN